MITIQRKTFSGADVSLFHIAMKEYGDALMWVNIAAANGISDPMITGTVALIIPPKPVSDNGGLPSL